MAACTHAVGTADTTVSPNTSGSFTPAANDLLVVFVTTASSVGDDDTLSSSDGLTFTRFAKGLRGSGSTALHCFVANEPANAVSQTVTHTIGSDPHTGTNIQVVRVSGMSRYGSDAIRQFAQEDNRAAGSGNPDADFASAALTGNVTIGVVSNSSNPAGLTAPTNWTEQSDIGHASPDSGLQYVTRDSGFTGTNIAWGAASASGFCVVIVELDTSSASEQGSGAASLPLLTASGTGKKTRKGTGALTLPLLSASGAGKKARKGSGTPSLPVLTAAGVGESTPATVTHSGSGAASLPILTASGSGKKTRKGTGALTLPLLSASGAGKKTRKGVGAATLPLLTAAGAGKKTRKGTGTPVLPLLSAAGAARHLVLAGSEGGTAEPARSMWTKTFQPTMS